MYPQMEVYCITHEGFLSKDLRPRRKRRRRRKLNLDLLSLLHHTINL